MIDKLAYFKSNRDVLFADTANRTGNIARSIRDLYKEMGFHVRLEPVTGGTLGVTFKCYGLPEGPCFIKSHLPGEDYMASLEKECGLLQIANGSKMNVKSTCFKMEDGEHLFLQMDILHEIQEVTPALVHSLIKEYQNRLGDVLLVNMYDIEALWLSAWNELKILYEKEFLSDSTYQQARESLAHLQDEFPSLQRCVCHGDLGDKNIMIDRSGHPVVIDWEDAFWGCTEYDYLYWLTFFNHRRFYQYGKQILMGIEPGRAISIMIMIVILKCAISFYSGSYLGNSLSMDERINEIWKVWGGT